MNLSVLLVYFHMCLYSKGRVALVVLKTKHKSFDLAYIMDMSVWILQIFCQLTPSFQHDIVGIIESDWYICVCMCFTWKPDKLVYNFCESIVLEVILEIYFTFLIAEGCKDRTLFYLGKADKILEICVLLMHLSNNIVSCICMAIVHSLNQISASSGKNNRTVLPIVQEQWHRMQTSYRMC